MNLELRSLCLRYRNNTFRIRCNSQIRINLEIKLTKFAFKWKQRKVGAPKIWKETYTNSDFEVISKDNFLEFLI